MKRNDADGLFTKPSIMGVDDGAWRSLVAHLPWEQGVGRSNRLAPIGKGKTKERDSPAPEVAAPDFLPAESASSSGG